MEQQTTGTVSPNDSAQPSNVENGQQPTNGTAAQDMAQAPAVQPKNNKKRNWIIATIVILLLIIGGASYYISCPSFWYILLFTSERTNPRPKRA